MRQFLISQCRRDDSQKKVYDKKYDQRTKTVFTEKPGQAREGKNIQPAQNAKMAGRMHVEWGAFRKQIFWGKVKKVIVKESREDTFRACDRKNTDLGKARQQFAIDGLDDERDAEQEENSCKDPEAPQIHPSFFPGKEGQADEQHRGKKPHGRIRIHC